MQCACNVAPYSCEKDAIPNQFDPCFGTNDVKIAPDRFVLGRTYYFIGKSKQKSILFVCI